MKNVEKEFGTKPNKDKNRKIKNAGGHVEDLFI